MEILPREEHAKGWTMTLFLAGPNLRVQYIGLSYREIEGQPAKQLIHTREK